MNTEIAAIREALNWLPNIDEKIHAIAMCDRLEAQAKGDEPVAWMRILHGEMSVIGPRFKSENEGDYPDYDTPLYAHPPQPSPATVKVLTDSEIERLSTYGKPVLTGYASEVTGLSCDQAKAVLFYARDNGYLSPAPVSQGVNQGLIEAGDDTEAKSIVRMLGGKWEDLSFSNRISISQHVWRIKGKLFRTSAKSQAP